MRRSSEGYATINILPYVANVSEQYRDIKYHNSEDDSNYLAAFVLN